MNPCQWALSCIWTVAGAQATRDPATGSQPLKAVDPLSTGVRYKQEKHWLGGNWVLVVR